MDNMIKINDYTTKNHLNEWEIKDLPDSEVYRLDLPNGDLSILFYLTNIKQLYKSKIFIPSLPNNNKVIHNTENCISHKIYTLDNNSCTETGVVQNITPDWSKYIAKDNAVLFLSETDARKYKNIQQNIYVLSNNGIICNLLDKEGIIPSQNRSVILHHFRKISIILPSIHSKNIQEISNIAKDLKENYGVGYVEVLTPKCYLSIFYDKTPHVPLYGLQYHLANYECEDDVECINYIDKIITTDSTGILKVQDTDKLKVVDCEEFFTN